MYHGQHLTTFEPLSGLIITADRMADGWTLYIRHRHHSGLYTDCDIETFEKLTSDELVQVVEAVAFGLLAVRGPGDLEH